MCRMMIRFLRSYTLFICIALAAPLAHAIDNPDAPDYVAEFEQRAQPFEKHFNDQVSIVDIGQAGMAYAKFLDKEFNQAYQLLLKKITNPEAREQLKKSPNMPG